MADIVDRIADILIEDHVAVLAENKRLRDELHTANNAFAGVLQELEGAQAKIERLTNRIAYLQHEMKRHLPILETLHANAYEWETCAAGTGVATLNGYRAALNTEAR